MTMHHFWAQNVPLLLIHFFSQKNVFYLAIFLRQCVNAKNSLVRKLIKSNNSKISQATFFSEGIKYAYEKALYHKG